MRISDWSSDVCSSDLVPSLPSFLRRRRPPRRPRRRRGLVLSAASGPLSGAESGAVGDAPAVLVSVLLATAGVLLVSAMAATAATLASLSRTGSGLAGAAWVSTDYTVAGCLDRKSPRLHSSH